MAIVVTKSNEAANATVRNVTFDAANAGDLLIAIIFGDGTGTFTWAGTNTATELLDVAAGTVARVAVAYRIATGSESAITTTGIDATCSVSERSTHLGIRIPAGEWHGTTAPEIANAASASTANPNPPALNPAGWDVESTLWIAGYGSDSGAVTAYPTNYTDNQNASETTTSAAYGAIATRVNAVASEDPGTFTNSTTDDAVAFTIAVRPVASGPQTVTLGLLDGAPALYAPTLTPKNTLTIPLLDGAPALYAPTLLATNTLVIPLLDGAPALYAPTLANLLQFIEIPLLDGGPALYAPTLTPKNLLTIPLLDAGPALYAPTITPKNTLTIPFLDGAPALYAPSITSTQIVTLPLLDSAPALYAPTLTPTNLLTIPLLDAGPALYAPTLVATNTLVLPLLDASPALYAPTLLGINALVLPLLDAGAALYAPTIEHQLSGLTITLPLLDAFPALYAPLIENDDPAQRLADAITMQEFWPQFRKVRDHKAL